MNTAKYLLAKYIPDLQRIEPRNIGLILWTPNVVEARFLAEKPGKPGEVDGRSIPLYVASDNAYKQWIAFWRGEVEKQEIQPLRGGRNVPRSSPDFLDILAGMNKGQFVLAEGGTYLDAIVEADIGAEANRLFSNLVMEAASVDELRDPTLDEVCNRLIRETGLSADPHFRTSFEIQCDIGGGTKEPYEFSYAYQNGTLHRLYHRVSLAKKKGMQRKNVHDSAWMFEKVIKAGIIRPDQGAVLVHASEEQKAEPEVERNLRVLSSVTRVLNVADPETVKREFAELRKAG